MALSMRTIIRNENWRNGLRLYSHDAAIEALISPQGSFDLENNYGVKLFRIGKIKEAKTHFENRLPLV